MTKNPVSAGQPPPTWPSPEIVLLAGNEARIQTRISSELPGLKADCKWNIFVARLGFWEGTAALGLTMFTRRLGRAYRNALWAGALLAALNLCAFLYLLLGSDAVRRGWVSDIAGILIPFVAAIACFSFRRQSSVSRLSNARHLPLVLGLAALSYSIGMAIYTYETRYLGLSGNPGWADPFYLLQYALFIWATCVWPSRPIAAVLRWRAWSDAFVLMVALLAFWWVYLIGPAILGSQMSNLGILIDIAFPVADMMIVFCVMQLMRKGFDPRFRTATHLFLFAVVINTIGDLYYSTAQIDGVYSSGHWLDMSWPVTASMAALAGVIIGIRIRIPGFSEARDNERIVIPQRPWTLYAPYILVPGVGWTTYNVAMGGADPLIKNGVYLCGLALIVAILIRQLLVIAENGSLYAKLSEAYAELETKSRQVLESAHAMAAANERLQFMASELAGQNRTLAESNEALEDLATRDSMTGLANHRAFQVRMREYMQDRPSDAPPIGLALIDVDEFKSYNDQFGHPSGDEVICSIARLLQAAARSGDLAARYGGEEFALLMPDIDRDDAVHLLERLRLAVESFSFPHRRVTLSIGLCMSTPRTSTPQMLLKSADRALYAAKSRGRNRLVESTESRSSDLNDLTELWELREAS